MTQYFILTWVVVIAVAMVMFPAKAKMNLRNHKPLMRGVTNEEILACPHIGECSVCHIPHHNLILNKVLCLKCYYTYTKPLTVFLLLDLALKINMLLNRQSSLEHSIYKILELQKCPARGLLKS